MTLALIRHVTPLIDRGVCDTAEAARRVILYDTTQIWSCMKPINFNPRRKSSSA